jgi:hypothetical protein
MPRHPSSRSILVHFVGLLGALAPISRITACIADAEPGGAAQGRDGRRTKGQPTKVRTGVRSGTGVWVEANDTWFFD